VRVLVTRPEPGASRTAAKLRAMGFEPVLLPLSETKPLDIPRDPIPESAVAVAITSANAIRHAPPGLIQRLAALPCHTVGKRTAEAAHTMGFGQVEEGPGDAAGLAEMIGERLAGKILVYLCGRDRFPGFEERLAAASVRVRPVETYETIAMHHSDDAVLSRLSGRPVDAVLLYSAKAAERARALVGRPTLQPLFEQADIYALSGRIAAAYRSTPAPGPSPQGGGEAAAPKSHFPLRGEAMGGGESRPCSEIHVAPAPTEETLLALLARAG
jgi:uroporphyrinogen-III synthase